jgi:hypothetical protein
MTRLLRFWAQVMQALGSWGLWLGPISLLSLGAYVLVRALLVMWGGLLALYVGVPVICLLHLVMLGVLGAKVVWRLRRRQGLTAQLYGWVSYYVGMPVLVLALVLKIQGWSGFQAWIELIWREGRFWLVRLMGGI